MFNQTMTAQDVLAIHWDGTLPVRPEILAKRLGVGVFSRSDMEESGYIYIDESNQPRIVFNRSEPLVRRRFTVAHELGHYASGDLMHGQTMWRDTRENFMSTAHNPREVAANRFAAELLMPAQHVVSAVSHGAVTLPALAELFQVSEVAMKYRLLNLGMLRG